MLNPSKLRKAGAHGVGQGGRQFIELVFELIDRLARTAQAQGITADEVILYVARHLPLKLLGQAQVTLHQQIGAFEGFLRPPQGRAKRSAHGD
ncbi:hypothetical protein [Pseudomonas sp. TH10]|uniref:hypothetical protein n=1 Tax=Pseudomonas sp. TH10 TaxID=2796376 RepID=UPI0035A91F4B